MISSNQSILLCATKNFIEDHLRGFLTITPRQSNNEDECHLKQCKVY